MKFDVGVYSEFYLKKIVRNKSLKTPRVYGNPHAVNINIHSMLNRGKVMLSAFVASANVMHTGPESQ
jgi:hypothetical protein